MKKIQLIGLLGCLLPVWGFAQYTGTASVTQGLATATTGNLYECSNGRVTRLGTITASNNTVWTVPAVTNFVNTAFPFASDLNNACIGANYATSTAALAALNGTDIVTVDADGEVVTAYIFADNYFEMYINGVAVGKDKVPFTQFNSSIVRFRVKKPFTIAMLLVDWEENLGLGSELNGGFAYHPGDGGMVAVFKDSSNKIIAATGDDWKAQTYYTAPVTDLTCPSENGTKRLSNNCSTANSNNGTTYYGLHWPRPNNWQTAAFDDADWPKASEYTNADIGVNNKPAYTNFTNIFDDPTDDAAFIWSSNVILDNEVIVRYTVPMTTAVSEFDAPEDGVQVYPNPFRDRLFLKNTSQNTAYQLFNAIGQVVFSGKNLEQQDFSGLPPGIYFLKIADRTNAVLKLIKT